MSQTAMILATGLLDTPFAKTTHGLLRGPSRYRILGVIDPDRAGRDAGEILDGHHRDIPVLASLPDLLKSVGQLPDACIVGVATVGGKLPPSVREGLVEAAAAGITLINGLHHLLGDDPQLRELANRHGGGIIDLRKPRPVAELCFWSGKILDLSTPRIAVLGTDCAVGKRTTCSLLWQRCRQRGLRAEMIYTGQTGWLQGVRHGFILDATPNDFVCGELESAVLRCQRETDPELIFLEGQSGLRNPSGPCGSELILAGGAAGVVLQHAPGRRYYEGLEEMGSRIPPVREEIEMIRLLGSDVWAVTLNDEGLDRGQARRAQERLAHELALPVVDPLHESIDPVIDAIREHLELEAGAR